MILKDSCSTVLRSQQISDFQKASILGLNEPVAAQGGLWAQPGYPWHCQPTRVLSLEGEHLSGVQQQQAPGPETQVDPLLGPSHCAAPEEVHRQKAQPVILQ